MMTYFDHKRNLFTEFNMSIDDDTSYIQNCPSTLKCKCLTSQICVNKSYSKANYALLTLILIISIKSGCRTSSQNVSIMLIIWSFIFSGNKKNPICLWIFFTNVSFSFIKKKEKKLHEVEDKGENVQLEWSNVTFSIEIIHHKPFHRIIQYIQVLLMISYYLFFFFDWKCEQTDKCVNNFFRQISEIRGEREREGGWWRRNRAKFDKRKWQSTLSQYYSIKHNQDFRKGDFSLNW